MIKENNGTKSIRIGWKNSCIKAVVLSDDTVLQNMQCNLNATIPNDEELEKINKENMKSKEDEIFSKFEEKECELEEITEMLWLVYEDYYSMQENDIYTKANNYDRLRPFLYNIHTLLYDRDKEMKEIIDEVYAERKAKNI